MKRFLSILVLLVASVVIAGAQEKLISHTSFGAKAAYEVTIDTDTVVFTPQYSITMYQVKADTNLVIQANTAKAVSGNVVYFQISADSTKRYVTFDENLNATLAVDTLNIAKSRTWGFVYVNKKFVQINRSAEY